MKKVKKQCYALYQEIVVFRDEVCQRPGCYKPAVSGHHAFGRNKMGTAFQTDGGLGLCNEDHDGWARMRPGEVKEVLLRKIGQKRYDELALLSRQDHRLRDQDFMDNAVRLGLELIELREKKRKEQENE